MVNFISAALILQSDAQAEQMRKKEANWQRKENGNWKKIKSERNKERK